MSAKHKGKGPQAVTANELRGGLNVWMTKDFAWSHDYADVFLTEDADVIEKMQAAADKDSEANLIVAAYFIDVEPDTGLPVRYREKFRVKGPSYDTAEEMKKAK